MQTSKHVLATAALMLTAAGFATPAAAMGHQDFVNATGACNGALPAYEGALRKRPTAIANEGTTHAFVSCSLTTDGIWNQGNEWVFLVLTNRGTQPVAVSCTFVDGVSPEVSGGALGPNYYPALIAVPAGGFAIKQWLAADEGVPLFTAIANFNCNLPPKVEINAVSGAYDDGL